MDVVLESPAGSSPLSSAYLMYLAGATARSEVALNTRPPTAHSRMFVVALNRNVHLLVVNGPEMAMAESELGLTSETSGRLTGIVFRSQFEV
jgi:hypothetical protein